MKRIGVFLSITILLSVLAGSGVVAAPAAPGGLSVVEASEENIELLGHLGGQTQAIEVVGNYAYAGIGPEFAVLDVSDPAHVQRVGWLVAAGEVMDIAIQADYAYLAYRDTDFIGTHGAVGLQVVDIRHPTLPASLAVMELIEHGVCGSEESVVVEGDSLYLAFYACEAFGSIIAPGGSSIYRLDITYPANPVVLDRYGEVAGWINGLAASPGWLYALVSDFVGSHRMIVFDISSPGSMVETASITSPPVSRRGLALMGEYALAGGDSLWVIDISDPTQPAAVITHTLSGPAHGVFTDGTLAYFPLESSSILILDMADPLNPVYRGGYHATGQPLDLSLDGANAYSANGWQGLEIFDTAALTQRGMVIQPQRVNDIATAGGYAFSAAEDGFWVLDVSDPAMPFPVAHLADLQPAVSLVLKGSYAIVAYPDNYIGAIDISDPLAPTFVNFFYLPSDLRQLVLVNNTLFAAAGADGLRILDVSDINQLEEIGAFTAGYGVNAVAVAGRYAYLATSNANLVVLDVAAPDSPEMIGLYDPPDSGYGDVGWGNAVAVQGGTVLFGVTYSPPTPLAGYSDGSIFIVDVSEPENPVEVGRISRSYGWAPQRVGLEDGRAYIVYERQGLYILDISDPSTVQVLGSYNPSEWTYGMTVDEDRIYLYNQSTFILRYLDPNLPSFGGVVSHANGQPYPGVPVSIGGILPDKVSDTHGVYAFRGVPEGIYSLTPSLPGYVFHPPSRTVSVPPNAFGQNFTILPEPVQLDFTPGISATLRFTDTQELPTWLDIPGNASATPLTLQVVPTMGAGAPGYAFAGHAFGLNAAGAGEGAAGFVFNEPLTATIQYSPWDVAVITDPDNLALWWWDGTAWQDAAQSCSPAGEYSRDPDNYILSLPICQTGSFKLMGSTQQVYLPMIPAGD